jgi:hypothetical protein
MKPRYKSGDSVTVNGRVMEITYWPADNENYFTAKATSHDGGLETFTYHVTQLVEGEQPLSDDDVAATGVTGRGKRKA